MLRSCNQQSLTRGIIFCHESWYLLVSAERPHTSHTVYSMTGLHPHLICTNFIYYYAIIRIHLNGIILILRVEHSTVLVMPPKKLKPTKKWSMYPSLHNDVSDLLREHDLFFQFYEKDDGKSCMNDYDTNIMGRFTCHNRACPARVWTSKQIAITIRRYSDNRYNQGGF
jgi:hypothetical protein